jgi:uncharacterized membrane protein
MGPVEGRRVRGGGQAGAASWPGGVQVLPGGAVALGFLASSVEGATLARLHFENPIWFWLIPAMGLLLVWLARASLSGLGTNVRRVALGVRLLVVALVAAALAEPTWRRESKDVAVTFIVDVSRSVPVSMQRQAEQWAELARKSNENLDDYMGVVTVGMQPMVQALPSRLARHVEKNTPTPDLGTDLAAGVRLGMAIKREDAAQRFVIVSDFNETQGSLLDAAEAARAIGIPIDVLPVTYRHEAEVMMEELIAPATARMGETVNLRVVLHSTAPARGLLHLLVNGDPVDLDPGGEGMGQLVELEAGTNVLAVPIALPRHGPQEFRALFEPLPGRDGRPTDVTLENNEALAVTFVTSEGRVLVVADSNQEGEAIARVLEQARLAADVVGGEQLPTSLTALNAYDAIIMVNQPAYVFSQQSQEELRQYVHDTGGGLIMVGGPNAFGAGGWIGSPLEDALPVKLDPPQKRQMPRGALALIMHSIEMPDGVSYGKKTAQSAAEALSRLDLIGIIEYTGGANFQWVHPLSEVGDGSAVRRSINRLAFGDMKNYEPAFQMALQGLNNVEAGTRHIILITDGDGSAPSQRTLQQLKKDKITVSTVGVFPHGMSDLSRLQMIARETGGRYYEVTTTAGLGNIVQIFVKEAQTVRRSLIWEGPPFAPSISGAAETMRGIRNVPVLSGYIVTAERGGHAMVSLRGKENDPILAQWQYGLGRTIAYMSDAAPRWNQAWVGWPGFKAFWEQHIRWAMRPAGSANVRVTTEKVGSRTRVLVDALDTSGERLNFARFRGRVANPDGTAQDVELKQVGPGRYEGMFDSGQSGSFVVSLRYVAPAPGGGGKVLEGSVQAAVTRPFADEFRAMTDNEPLMRQVAAMTGGRVLSGDPKLDDLWRRDGLSMPVSARPIWLWFAMLAIGMFLMDVAVRRVRIDVHAMARAVARTFQAGKTTAGQQMDALRAAREQAQRGMAGRTGPREGAADGVPLPPPPLPTAAAGVKFEASAERLKRRDVGQIAIGAEEPSVAGTGAGAGKAKAAPAVSKEEGLSRLMQAKKRAREEMDE